jgi:hypothetical protein
MPPRAGVAAVSANLVPVRPDAIDPSPDPRLLGASQDQLDVLALAEPPLSGGRADRETMVRLVFVRTASPPP